MSGVKFSPGERIREYEIVDLIGKGGMGAVYRARHVYLNVDRAIKFIHPSLDASTNFLERFIREAKILTELSHPNLVRFYEFGELEPEVFYIVMEFLTGDSVRKKIGIKGKIPIAESIRIIREAASALGSAHAKGIVHRDISPDNLMIVKSTDGRDTTKVIDFGIAKSIFDSQTFTQIHHFLGKPQYASPEQAGLQEVMEIDGRSDIYSLGITFYQMLSGALPFSSLTPQGYLFKHATETPQPISSHLPRGYVSADLERIISRTLTKKREDRYPTMEHLIWDLDRIETSDAETILLDVEHKREPSQSETVQIFDSPVSSAPKRWPRLRLHFAIMFLVVLGAGYYFYSQTMMLRSAPPEAIPPAYQPPPEVVPDKPVPVEPKHEIPPPKMTPIEAPVRTIMIRSNPSGAEVFVEGKKIGSTPLKFDLPANDSKELTFRLKGYESVSGIIDKNSSDSISIRLEPK